MTEKRSVFKLTARAVTSAAAVLTALALAIAYYNFIYLHEMPFKYFKVDCSIYDTDAKLIFKTNGIYCDFSSDGKILAAEPYKNLLVLKDKNDKTMFTADISILHELKFSPDQKSFIAINSEVIDLNNEKVRSDCVSRRNFSNDVLSSWCVSQHLPELAGLGFSFQPPTLYVCPTSPDLNTARIAEQ